LRTIPEQGRVFHMNTTPPRPVFLPIAPVGARIKWNEEAGSLYGDVIAHRVHRNLNKGEPMMVVRFTDGTEGISGYTVDAGARGPEVITTKF